MPFTPSHAVVAIPFAGTRLVPAAIAIGSMTPDDPLFFRFGPDYWFTHSWWGLAVWDVPLAFLLLLVWRLLLRPATAQLTPRWFAQRWPAEWSEPASGWWELWGGRTAPGRTRVVSGALLVLSLAIGVATHILWDDFTHEGRWGSVVLPWLNAQAGPFALYEWAHYVCSVLALIVIAVWGYRWLSARKPHYVEAVIPGWVRLATWLALPASLLLAAGVLAALGRGPAADGLRPWLEHSGTTGAAVFLVLVAVVSLVVVARSHGRGTRQNTGE